MVHNAAHLNPFTTDCPQKGVIRGCHLNTKCNFVTNNAVSVPVFWYSFHKYHDMFDLGVKKQTTHAGVIYVMFDTWIPVGFQKGLVSNGDCSGERLHAEIIPVVTV